MAKKYLNSILYKRTNHSTVPACVTLETSVRGHHGLDGIQ